jgi:RNA polymerase sigma-70 factor (ECF subfamily)
LTARLTSATRAPTDPDPDPELETALENLIDAARQAWPDIAVAPEIFVDYLAERITRGVEPHLALQKMHVNDLYLACGCAHGLPQAMSAFDRSHLSQLGAALARIDRSADFADEVRQHLRERIFIGPPPRILDYTGSGPLGGWLRVAAWRTALNLRRQASIHEHLMDSPPQAANPELDAIHQQYRGEVESAIKHALSHLDSEQREILRLHYLEGMNLEKIGRHYSIDRSVASRRVSAARQFLLATTKRELARLLPMTDASLNSLLVGLQSKLNITIQSVLGG